MRKGKLGQLAVLSNHNSISHSQNNFLSILIYNKSLISVYSETTYNFDENGYRKLETFSLECIVDPWDKSIELGTLFLTFRVGY